jgi:hypothetical protein
LADGWFIKFGKQRTYSTNRAVMAAQNPSAHVRILRDKRDFGGDNPLLETPNGTNLVFCT